MDMTGAMPRSAWFEIRDETGELLASVPARIDGGSISAELPTFPAGTTGSIQLCTGDGKDVHRDPAELGELPASPVVMVVQMG
jgi:hypothetical protein